MGWPTCSRIRRSGCNDSRNARPSPDTLWQRKTGFLRESRPHMLVLHQPPYGYHDVLPGHGHSGSPVVRDFVDESDVSIVLSGHHHEQWGTGFSEGTWFFNPSNFGRTVEVSGARPGGFFFDIAVQNKRVEAATLRRIEKKGIFDIVDYQYADKNPETLVLDEQRHVLLGGKARKTPHIKPIRQFQRIKSFFLNYETPESVTLIKELRSIYRKIHDKGMEVAFDLLGSISFGIA
ncbi:MAG: metallophosphoesterase, partial [Deltaproteobacteria bacterium]|nr:metallophosphoesterase [Deltaproteobacteria bacterium]